MALSDPLFPAQVTTDSTGAQDDFVFSNTSVLRCNNASALTIRGLQAGLPGQRLTVFSLGAGQVDLANEDSNSAAANRLLNGVTGTVSLAAGAGRVELVYDGTSSRWRVLTHEQGAWITPTFSAGDYFGNGSMTWSVDSGDVTTFAYQLRGRSLSIMFQVLSTSVGGTPGTQLQRTIPGGFTSVKTFYVPCYADDAGTVIVGRVGASAGATALNIRRDMAGITSWSASTNLTGVIGELTLEVA